MVTFPARRIVDVRVYDRSKGEQEAILYHNEEYNKELSAIEIERLHIKFNLYDEERKKYILIERNFGEVFSFFNNPNLRKIRLETVADSKIQLTSYDYNNIWGSL